MARLRFDRCRDSMFLYLPPSHLSRALRLEHPGAIWHITSRGIERRPIFLDDPDRQSFVDVLADLVDLHGWLLHAWVLMENHYHLLLETPRIPTLSRGIKRLNETHALRFNARHRRVGHLFQGRFKGILVERESHLLELTRYIVLNPVRCGAVRFPGDWEWSNYRATAGLAAAPPWLEIDWTLAQFAPSMGPGAHEEYRHFVADARGAAYNPWEDLVGQIFLGGRAFCDSVQARIDAVPRSREHPREQRRVVLPAFDSIIELVAKHFCFGVDGELRRKSRGPGRKALAHLGWREGDVPLAAIAERLEVTLDAVSKMIRSSKQLERSDGTYRDQLEAIRRELREGEPLTSPDGGEANGCR